MISQQLDHCRHHFTSMESFRQWSDQSSLRRQRLCRRFHYQWYQWLQCQWMAMGCESTILIININ